MIILCVLFRKYSFVPKRPLVTCEKKFFSLVCWSVCLSKRLFWGVGNHLKHVEMQKKKKNSQFFFLWGGGGGPSPKFNGMILGPYLTPPPSFVEIHRGVFPEYCSQTNKRQNLSVAVSIAAASIAIVAAASIASIAGGGPVTKP